MSKRAVQYSVVFAINTSGPAPVGTIDFYNIPGFDIRKLFAIIDVSVGPQKVLYAAGVPGLGATVTNSPRSGTNNFLTLQAPVLGCSVNDTIMVIYDDGDQASAASYVQQTLGGAVLSNTNRLPVEVDAQSAGLALNSTLTSAYQTLTALQTLQTAPSTAALMAVGTVYAAGSYFAVSATVAGLVTVALATSGQIAIPVVVGFNGPWRLQVIEVVSSTATANYYNLS